MVDDLNPLPGGGGNGPEGGGAGRMGSIAVGLKPILSLGLLGRPPFGPYPSKSRERLGGGPELLEMRGGKPCLPKVAVCEGYMPTPLTSAVDTR